MKTARVDSSKYLKMLLSATVLSVGVLRPWTNVNCGFRHEKCRAFLTCSFLHVETYTLIRALETVLFFPQSDCFFKKFSFSQTLWPCKRKWLHALWPAWWDTRVATAQLQGCRRKKRIFHKPLWFLHKNYSFRVALQVALHPAKINISLFIFSQACKGQVWGVKCHCKLILSTHKHKN